MSNNEDNVRQRIKTEKAALKEKVEEIRKKMKEKEANQQRWQGLFVMLKPALFIMLVLLVFIGLFVYFTTEMDSQSDDTMEVVEEVEEIFAEDEL